jgi:hypothetical protein
MRNWLSYILLIAGFQLLSHYSCYGQSTPADSTLFHHFRNRLGGCWESRGYRFCYNSEQNFGHESQSRFHSSAPMFKLTLHKDNVCMEWTELTGGSTFLPLLKITRRKIVFTGADGKRYVYRRSKPMPPKRGSDS